MCVMHWFFVLNIQFVCMLCNVWVLDNYYIYNIMFCCTWVLCSFVLSLICSLFSICETIACFMYFIFWNLNGALSWFTGSNNNRKPHFRPEWNEDKKKHWKENYFWFDWLFSYSCWHKLPTFCCIGYLVGGRKRKRVRRFSNFFSLFCARYHWEFSFNVYVPFI